jgi:putative methanogenesis marker protein 8
VTEHLLEMAKALVKIKDGEILVLSDPQIRSCPLRRELYGLEKESRRTVERVLKEHMNASGMYGPMRALETDERPVSFGASEILADGMQEGLVEAAVVVCEGAGTVAVTRPNVLQAVGAHMTGLIETGPIEEVQSGLECRECLLLDRLGTIDQVRGFEMAAEAGFQKIAVTIAGTKAIEAQQLREKAGKLGIKAIILAVHTTGINRNEAEILADNCDLVWACASRLIREIAGRKSLLQIGVSIPVFALTQEGKRLILNRALHFPESLVIHRASLPMTPSDKQPDPLI